MSRTFQLKRIQVRKRIGTVLPVSGASRAVTSREATAEESAGTSSRPPRMPKGEFFTQGRRVHPAHLEAVQGPGAVGVHEYPEAGALEDQVPFLRTHLQHHAELQRRRTPGARVGGETEAACLEEVFFRQHLTDPLHGSLGDVHAGRREDRIGYAGFRKRHGLGAEERGT